MLNQIFKLIYKINYQFKMIAYFACACLIFFKFLKVKNIVAEQN